MTSDVLVHLKHVHPSLSKHGIHSFVADDLALVVRVLQIVCFDVLPKLFDDLGARELGLLDYRKTPNNGVDIPVSLRPRQKGFRSS